MKFRQRHRYDNQAQTVRRKNSTLMCGGGRFTSVENSLNVRTELRYRLTIQPELPVSPNRLNHF